MPSVEVPSSRDLKPVFDVSAWLLLLSLALNTLSAAIVPLAAEDNSFTVSGVRIADLLLVSAGIAALARGIPTGGIHIWLLGGVWTVWTLLAAYGFTTDEFSAYRAAAEWQFPVYLIACWLVLHSIAADRWRVWATRAIRSQIAILVFGSLWSLSSGRAGADVATISCVVAVVAFTLPEIKRIERAVALAAALILVVISGQRAAFLLTLLPLLAAGGFWMLRLPRERLSRLSTWLVVVVVVTLPLLIAVRLDSTLYRQIVSYAQHAFFRQAKQLSVDSRLVQWEVARNDISEAPVAGKGVGGAVVKFNDPGIDRSAISNITHNTALDLALRFGIPAAVLVGGALVLLVAGRMRAAWTTGSFLLWICAWAVAALFAKGMVESVLFKPRLVPVLAILTAALAFHRTHSTDARSRSRGSRQNRGALQQELGRK